MKSVLRLRTRKIAAARFLQRKYKTKDRENGSCKIREAKRVKSRSTEFCKINAKISRKKHLPPVAKMDKANALC